MAYIEEDNTGLCFMCKHWDAQRCYCNYYRIFTDSNGYEPTCKNTELVKYKEDGRRQH